MADEPKIDGRTAAEILDDARDLAPFYTDEWDPDSEDAGAALLGLFSELAADVVERLDRVPAKHRVAFFDRLGFGNRPPQPARLPLVFHVADGAGRTVSVPGGTRAVAEAEGGERTFETAPDDGFEATPAGLDSVYSVDPATDEVFEHAADLQAGERTPLFRRESERDRQRHALYVGHADQLAVEPDESENGTAGPAIRVELATDAPLERFTTDLVWEFFGTKSEDGPEDWHRFEGEIAGERVLRLSGEVIERYHERVAGLLHENDFPPPAAPWTAGRADEAFPIVGADGADRDVLLDAFHEFPDWDPDLEDGAFQESRRLDLPVEGSLVETEVEGVESRWVRCRVPADDPDRRLFEIAIGSEEPTPGVDPIRVGPAPRTTGLEPDALLANDVELPTESTSEPPGIYPLGTVPRPQNAFYVASSEAFTKAGATVDVEFLRPPELAEPGKTTKNEDASDGPDLAWEYWDGSAWSRLPIESDGTAGLTAPAPTDKSASASVSFAVPEDLEETTVFGHEGHWVRCRLVGGDYGGVTAIPGGDGSWTTELAVDPPRYAGVSVALAADGLTKPAEHLLAENNLTVETGLEARDRVTPFVRLPDESQTLYLGFDGPLDDGPITLLFDLADHAYPETFHARLRWEYRRPTDGKWVGLQVRDGTEGLTGRGIVGLVFPEETVASGRFGRERHWVRARVAGTQFERLQDETVTDHATDDEPDGLPVCGESVRTAPPAGEPSREPPGLDGLHVNAVWARNVRTVESETLGSSDGTQDQAFVVSNPPVIDAEVWVDERQALSEGQRRALSTDQPDRVEVEDGTDGGPGRFWVRWEAVPDLLDSGPDDRHYTIERATGEIVFGDGHLGRIPPPGTDSLRASYESGGGADGNVDAGAVAGLKSAIPFVDGVENPLPADGGADEESTEEVVDRAPRELRDRGRAVTAADFERIATDASRRLARVRAIPGMDRAGERAPGWVTLLVVPSGPGEKPVPSVTLRQQVHEAVAERAPATLVTAPDQLVVRGPSYVSVSVQAALVAAPGAGSVSALEERAAVTVDEFLHPLAGGEDGEGWSFGALPHLSDLYALLEGVEGVDHVADLSMHVQGSGPGVTVREGEETPGVSRDALLYSGAHEIEAGIARKSPKSAAGGS